MVPYQEEMKIDFLGLLELPEQVCVEPEIQKGQRKRENGHYRMCKIVSFFFPTRSAAIEKKWRE